MILLVVTSSEEIEHLWVSILVRDTFEDHVLASVEREVPYVFHRLHERKRSSILLACLFLKMLRQSILLIEVVWRPEPHAGDKCHQELGQTTPHEGHLAKEL